MMLDISSSFLVYGGVIITFAQAGVVSQIMPVCEAIPHISTHTDLNLAHETAPRLRGYGRNKLTALVL